jgi:hypothetical protein
VVQQQIFQLRTTVLPGFGAQWGTTFNSFGEELIDTDYSRTLIELVHRCLAMNPANRPSPTLILNLTQQAIARFEEINEEVADFDRVELDAGFPPL